MDETCEKLIVTLIILTNKLILTFNQQTFNKHLLTICQILCSLLEMRQGPCSEMANGHQYH